MSYFDAETIARYRAMDTSGMPDQCSITRVSPGTVNADGSTEPGGSATVTYACRIAPLGSSPVEQVFASRLQNVTGFTITLPWDADVNERDTIVSGAQKFQVLGVLDPVSYSTNTQVATRRLT